MVWKLFLIILLLMCIVIYSFIIRKSIVSSSNKRLWVTARNKAILRCMLNKKFKKWSIFQSDMNKYLL